MYITGKCEAGISRGDLTGTDKKEISSKEAENAMSFIMTLHVLVKYLQTAEAVKTGETAKAARTAEADGVAETAKVVRTAEAAKAAKKSETADPAFTYRELWEQIHEGRLPPEQTESCVGKLKAAFEKYLRISQKNDGQKKKIVKRCILDLSEGRLCVPRMIVDNPVYAAEKIASWLEEGNCTVLVSLDTTEFDRTLAFIREDSYVYFMDIDSKIEAVRLHRKKATGCITLMAYIRSRISSYRPDDRSVYPTTVVCSLVAYRKDT